MIILASVIVSTAVGFALGGATNPSAADAASANSQIVTQLKKLNAKVHVSNTNLGAMKTRLDTLNTRIGDTQTAQGSVRGLLTIICDYTASISCKP